MHLVHPSEVHFVQTVPPEDERYPKLHVPPQTLGPVVQVLHPSKHAKQLPEEV